MSRGTWRAYLGLTMTGALGTPVKVSRSPLTHTLNSHDDLDITIDRASLDGVAPEWWSYRSGTLVITYTDGSGVERIISACPISSPHPEEDRANGTVQLRGKGVSWLLENRVVLEDDYTANTVSSARSTEVAIRNRTYRAIAAEVVHQATHKKRQGHLPIVLPDRGERGTRQRTYHGYNVSNNGAWKRLQELTEVIGGPDLVFRAEWANEERTRFQWRLIGGSDEQQTIPQVGQLLLDATSPATDVSSINVTSDASQVAHRVYATGAGEGAGVLLAQADVASMADDMPLIEQVISDSDADGDNGLALLNDKAQGALSSRTLDQVSLTIHADPDRYPIGTWWAGELLQLTTAGWLVIPDGVHLLRIVSVKYDLASDAVSIECQEDHISEEYAW